MDERDDSHWVGTWTTAPVPVDGIALSGQTLRMISRISIGGSRIRWDSGDHLHPNDLGYRHMADSIDLALFG